MNPTRNLKLFAQLTTVFTIAFALKYFYSTADVNELRWILAPTTLLVEAFTGMHFAFEPYAGYMSDDHTFLIAASCSGLNFMIISFVMLAVGRMWHDPDADLRTLPFSLITAYFATIAANTIRIVVALAIRGWNTGISWLGPGELHRLEGIVVYFGSLLLLFVVTESLGKRTSVSTLARRSILPLVIYYSVTLGVPIAGGAYTEVAFWKHSPAVLLAPLIVMLPLLIFSFAKSSYEGQRAYRRSSSGLQLAKQKGTKGAAVI